MAIEYREQIFVLTAAFTDAVRYERNDSYCDVTMKADDRVIEALEKLKKDTRAGVVSIEAENGIITTRIDLGFLSLNEPFPADLLREKSTPPKVPASERRKFIPFIVK